MNGLKQQIVLKVNIKMNNKFVLDVELITMKIYVLLVLEVNLKIVNNV